MGYNVSGRKYQNIVKETEMYANYIIEKNATIRDAERFFRNTLKHEISKSTIHYRIERILSNENKKLYNEVRKVLDKNKSERSIRGGMSTRIMYLNRKKEREERRDSD